MAKVDEGSSLIMDELFTADDECNDVFIDLDSFWKVMGSPTEPSQESMLDNSPSIDIPQEHRNSNELLSPRDELPGFGVLSSSHNSEASDCRTVCSDGYSESDGTSIIVDGGMLEPSSQLSAVDCLPVQGNGLLPTCVVGGSRNPTSYCQNDSDKAPFVTSNFNYPLCSYIANPVMHDGKSLVNCHLNREDDQLRFSGLDVHSENIEDASIIDGDMTSQEASHTESSSCEVALADIPDLPYFLDNPSYVPYSSSLQSFTCAGDRMVNSSVGKAHDVDFINFIPFVDLGGNHFGQQIPEFGSSAPLNDHVGVSRWNDMQDDIKAVKNVESITSNEIVSRASEVIDDIISRKYHGSAGKLPGTEDIQWSPCDSLPSMSYKNLFPRIKDEKEDMFQSKRTAFGPVIKSAIGALGFNPALQVSGQPGTLPSASVKAEINCQKMNNEVPEFNRFCLSNITYKGVWSNELEPINVDDDSDVCILEDLSAPAVLSNPTALNGKLVAASQFSTSRDPNGQTVMGSSRLKPNDERVIFRVAVQDLSQPKTEALPPDGVLAVPLLKHQRIALSWMVNKETKSVCCAGGILADDQGLGKTVSTIALILKERSPSAKAPKVDKEQSKMDMLNLDEEDEAFETYHVKEPRLVNNGMICSQSKIRPAAGTLIVCPTSVLRQWSDELHNKVTREASLSVLVYHGSSRTKDPLELAKYDVVITTYAIVSMEVPKQPVVDDNDDRIGTPFKGFSSNKKRKLLETEPGKKSSAGKKSKKGMDSELLETISGPLAKVGWFRVVLDEAQSIKNHRTQVARACWGLRAKRRWCLSGTPIQNAIDDLYSYFRFLRHEPYANFKTFCDHIKAPIHKNPNDGYKKLQAVLKTIMLRRTKGTYIDGEPIINLPPKTIELKRVDFSEEERDFYCRLESDSRAQFAEYAAAGTVKQNYVNILLMLLRLRQACDHPLLVKGFNSSSQKSSSIEMAKKLPREKHNSLVNCLEASLAICGICNDPPEDAVVTVCGHVFCNQCICEHMIGDNSQCPTKNCKTHLSSSHVFSKSTLRAAILDQQSPVYTSTLNCSDFELAKVSESHSPSCPQGSSKIKAALELLLSLSKFQNCVGEKAIVFSQWTGMLDLLEGFLKNSSLQYRRLDGTMPIAARDRAVKDFNTLPEVTVMIMSLKAASLGLNMVAACHVILLDLWWNPTTEDQAIDRAHRIGQTRPVSVFRLTVKDTVEDRILALQQKKREMVASAFGEDGTGGKETRLTVDDLEYLFRA
ncbi:hypothetical protein ACS0TY_032071 [Phlomoides rotata]